MDKLSLFLSTATNCPFHGLTLHTCMSVSEGPRPSSNLHYPKQGTQAKITMTSGRKRKGLASRFPSLSGAITTQYGYSQGTPGHECVYYHMCPEQCHFKADWPRTVHPVPHSNCPHYMAESTIVGLHQSGLGIGIQGH